MLCMSQWVSIIITLSAAKANIKTGEKLPFWLRRTKWFPESILCIVLDLQIKFSDLLYYVKPKPFRNVYLICLPVLIENCINQSKWRQVQNQAEFATPNWDVTSKELRKIRLILITYPCNPSLNPILVCIGIFGQYKSLFHCSQYLICIWTLKIVLQLCKAICNKTDFFCLPEQSAKLSQLG